MFFLVGKDLLYQKFGVHIEHTRGNIIIVLYMFYEFFIKEIIYATGSESGSVLMIQKGSGAELLSISSAAAGWSTRRYSIAAYSPGVQPPAYCKIMVIGA